MKRLSHNIIIKSSHDYTINHKVFTAYFRGTNNRVHYLAGSIVPSRCSKKELQYDLLHNSMENGVIFIW